MNESYYAGTSYGVSTTSGLTGALAAMGLFFWILSMALSILMIVSLWKIFKKAGKPGWASIIPIYNIYIMCEIAEKEWWYVLLSFVPFANIYAMIVLYNGMAKRFGKSGGFVAGMILLPVIFFPMLAFGKDAAIVNNQPNTSNENNMADNTLGANAAAVPNMNGQTMTSNEMVTPNNPVMSNPVGNVSFGNTSVESGLNSQNNESVQNNHNISAIDEPVMPKSNDNVAPTFDNVAHDNVQTPVMPNTMDAAQNVNVGQNIEPSLESNQNISVMDEPVMPKSNDNVAPTFNNVAQDNVQTPVMPNTMDAAQNVNVGQNIGQSLENVQNNTVMNEPVMPQPTDNVVPSFDNANNNAKQSINEEVSSNTKNTMNMSPSNQEEMLDINDESDAALENNIDTSKHTSLWSNNNQNNGQM
ncbi:MAG: DUF5684 domain-containing protein [Lachnospiraceae bacterium]